MTGNPLRYVGPEDVTPTIEIVAAHAPDNSLTTYGYVEELQDLNVTQGSVGEAIDAALLAPVKTGSTGMVSGTGSNDFTTNFITQSTVDAAAQALVTASDISTARAKMMLKSWIGKATSASVGKTTGVTTCAPGATYGVAGLVIDTEGKPVVPDSLMPLDSTSQQYPQEFFAPPAYNTVSVSASATPTTAYSFQMTLPANASSFQLLIWGVAQCAASASNIYPVVQVRSGSASGPIVATGAGTPQTYVGGLYTQVEAAAGTTSPTTGSIQAQSWTHEAYLAWVGGGGGGGAGGASGGSPGSVQYFHLTTSSSPRLTSGATIHYSLGNGGAASTTSNIFGATAGGTTIITINGTSLPYANGGGPDNYQLFSNVGGGVAIPSAAQPPGAPTFPNTPEQDTPGSAGNPPGGGGAGGQSGQSGGPGAGGGLYLFEMPVDSQVVAPSSILPVPFNIQPAFAGGATVSLYVTVEAAWLQSNGTTTTSGSGSVSFLQPTAQVPVSLFVLPIPTGSVTG